MANIGDVVRMRMKIARGGVKRRGNGIHCWLKNPIRNEPTIEDQVRRLEQENNRLHKELNNALPYTSGTSTEAKG